MERRRPLRNDGSARVRRSSRPGTAPGPRPDSSPVRSRSALTPGWILACGVRQFRGGFSFSPVIVAHNADFTELERPQLRFDLSAIANGEDLQPVGVKMILRRA